jgi:hypothetical protein
MYAFKYYLYGVLCSLLIVVAELLNNSIIMRWAEHCYYAQINARINAVELAKEREAERLSALPQGHPTDEEENDMALEHDAQCVLNADYHKGSMPCKGAMCSACSLTTCINHMSRAQ